MENRRRIFLIDRKIQGYLARRLVVTWLVGGLLILAFPMTINLLYGLFVASTPFEVVTQSIVQSVWLPSLTAILVIPIGVRHIIRFSNRIAGPMYRIKKDLKKLADGQSIRPIKLRDGDFFGDVAELVNQIAEQRQQLEPQGDSRSEPSNELTTITTSLTSVSSKEPLAVGAGTE